MSVTTSYPGIYIQELSSNSHAIVPAPTSIAAFVGYSHPFQTEQFNVAQECFSFNDYETYFGPLFSSGLVDASLPRAVYQFFLNGGSTAYVVGLQPGLFDQNDDLIPSMPRFGLSTGEAVSTGTTVSGGTSAAQTFTVNAANLVPTISSLSPASTAAVPSGGGNITLIINGSNFVAGSPGSTVNWNGTALATTYVSDTQITAQVPQPDIANPGTASVTVTNPGTAASAPLTFTVSSAVTAPAVISSLSPASVAAGGTTPFILTINGSNFVPGATVNWTPESPNTQPTATFLSSTQLTLSVTPGSTQGSDFPNAAGAVEVTVTNPGAGAQASQPFTFTNNNSNPVPVLSSLSPASVIAGGAAFTLSLNGSNFVPSSTVILSNGNTPTPVFVSASQLTVTMPAAAIASSGTLSVTVSNPTPGGGPSAAMPLVVNASGFPIPTISSLSPASATVSASQFTFTVYGANFGPGTTVDLNGAPATVSVLSASQLTVTVPAGTGAGPISVTVTNPPNGIGILFTALEFTDIVPMNVMITNVRNGGATFDAVVTYGSRLETYRGIQLTGTPAQQPAGVINGVSKLVQVAAMTSGYGTAITSQQVSLAFDLPANLNTCFSAADFIEGEGSAIPVFEPNSKLDNVEIFNLLMVPGVTDFSIISAALAFAERKRAFVIIDPPPQAPAFGSSIATPQPVQYWMEGLYSPSGPVLPLSQNGAIYFPYLTSNDPITGNNIPMAPSGFVAGVYAQTDANRGVWKAPAGLATVVLNTVGPVLSGAMNDPQQGVLNVESINCLRSFSGIGTVVWGSRTLVAANAAYQQWMYVPVRRMTLFIEQTLLANLRWVVFEPNDEPLWIAITSSINAFMLSLFRQGALQGSTPSDAFQVKCDSTTTSPADQAQGIVNILVAFAPLKPAEFVIIQIAQLAGQTAGS